MVGEHKPRQFPLCDCGIPAIAHRPSHNPQAWPICNCGARSENHRVKHLFVGEGEFCEKCNLIADKHTVRGPCSKDVYKHDYVGIDGEGIDREPHKYVVICAASIDGRRWRYTDEKGIKTKDALEWLLTSLNGSRVFSYGFGYDITCLLRDLPDKTLYLLLRPNARYDKGKLRPVTWRGYSLNWLQGKLTVSRGKMRIAIWDILKFYQQSFVKSLKDWQEKGEWDEVIERIERMKKRRSQFTLAELPKITDYCLDECFCLAQLAKKLLTAHKDSGLTLKSYFGPGSTASTALSQMGIQEYTKDPPALMTRPIAQAFFGGWFEHSYMGIVDHVYAYDISSAYPYHAYFLPCLLHGRWTHYSTDVRKRLRDCTTALVHYSYKGRKDDVWAPYPHRDGKGKITHPYRCQGWVWLPELRAARGIGETTLLEAWVYNTKCKCRPFEAIADYYRRRVELGKDARGKVLKLAVNSIYGKLAQSKGPNPKYQNWIWAGLITSGTRAQVLRALQGAPNTSDIIAIATDGIFSRCRLRLPKPLDTGTSDLAKPLGGWEEKEYPEGVLFLKPGIYMPLTGDATIKARGVGRQTLADDRDKIVQAWKEGKKHWIVKVDRFHGAKSCINKNGRSKRFGQWSKMPIKISFACPNRDENMGLLCVKEESVPYDSAVMTPEKIVRQIEADIFYEQP